MSYLILIALVVSIPLLILVLIRPNIATVAVIFLIYTNLPVILKKSLVLPEALVGSFVLILIAPLAFYLVIRREKVVIDAGFVLMSILLVISVISAILVAVDLTLALKWIMIYVLEGMLLYFLVINVVRDNAVLKQVIWTLLLAGSLLGSLSLVQDITRSYDNTFYDLALRGGGEIEDPDELIEKMKQSRFQRSELGKVRSSDRAAGPIGEPNRYAQIMIVILPLALFLFLGEGSRLRKVLAACAGLLILSGILLSFSRGAFLSLVLLFFILVFMGTVRLRQTINITLVLLLLMIFAAPGYFARLGTIGGVEGVISEDVEAKGAIAGRTTEMLAALNVFRDHPLLGVGPGQYSKFYSVKYQTDPAVAFRYLNVTRRAHSLYAETPAELGLIGFAAFMAIALVNLYQLWQLRNLALQRYTEIANISSAFLIGITAYFMTALFLHFSYQRYYWLLLAVSGAAIQIFGRELKKETGVYQMSAAAEIEGKATVIVDREPVTEKEEINDTSVEDQVQATRLEAKHETEVVNEKPATSLEANSDGVTNIDPWIPLRETWNNQEFTEDIIIVQKYRQLLEERQAATLLKVKTVHRLEGDNNGFYTVTQSGDGRWGLSGNGDASLSFWNLETGKNLRTLEGHTAIVSAVAMTSNGHFGLSASADATLRYWDLKTGECLHILGETTDPFISVAMSPDGHWALTGQRLGFMDKSRLLTFWDLSTGKLVHSWEGHREQVRSVALSSDSRWALSGGADNALRLWSLKTLEAVQVLQGHTNVVNSVAMTPDCRWGLSGSHDTTLRFWDLQAGICMRELEGHSAPVRSVALTANGHWGFSGDLDGSLRLWNLMTGECIEAFQLHTGYITSVSLTSDGCLGLSASVDNTLIRWRFIWDLELLPE